MMTRTGDDILCESAGRLATRDKLERQVRRIIAGSGASAETLARPLAVTSLAGNYRVVAGWTLALGGSPVTCLALVKNNGDATLITGGGGIVWRGGANPKLLADDDVLTLLAYIKSLGGWDRPGHWVEGVKSAGASFNVQPWFVHG